MAGNSAQELQAARARLARFVTGQTAERVFTQPTGHPSGPTGFCYCDGGLHRALSLYLRAAAWEWVLRLPCNRPRIWYLRRCGVQIGAEVHLSPGVWIDPMFPRLLTIEERVFVGTGVKIAMHEFRINEFRAGKVLIRPEAVIGAFAVIGCGVEIGARATVAAGAVVGRDVPPGTTAIGNPARIIRKQCMPS